MYICTLYYNTLFWDILRVTIHLSMRLLTEDQSEHLFTCVQYLFISILLFLATLLALEKAFMFGIWHSKRQLKLQILTSFSHFPHSCNSSKLNLLEHCYIVVAVVFVASFFVGFSGNNMLLLLSPPVDVAVSLSNCHFPLYNNCYV